jgi:Tol biopolymer transport system component
MSARYAGGVVLAAVLAAAASGCGGGQSAEPAGPASPGLYTYDTSDHALKLLIPGKHEREGLEWSEDGKWITSSDINKASEDVVPASGGRLRGVDSVLWSPDGKTVAYSKDGRLYVAQANWAQPRLVSKARGSDALDWSSDGRSLIFGTGRDSSCCWDAVGVARSDGTGARILWRPPSDQQYESWINWAEWSPTGQQIAAEATINNHDDFLYLLDPRGHGVKKLTDDVDSTSLSGWSRDGNWLGLASSSGAFRVAAKGGKPRALCPGGCRLATFSEDGSRVAFVTGPESKSTLWVEDVDGTGTRRIADDIRPAGVIWSRDGRKLGLTLVTPDGRHASLAVADAETGKIERLTDGSERDSIAELSSDGSMVAFYRVGPGRQVSLWVASTGGGDPSSVMRLTSNPELGPCPHLAWSPKAAVLAIANAACAPD